MIDAFIKFSIKQKVIVSALILGLIGWGIYSLIHLPVDAVPDITDNQVQVITQSSSLATQEVEQFLTAPLERAMSNIPGVEEIRSISRFGLSVITIVFEEQMDVYKARQLIGERLLAAKQEIPQGLGSPEMGPITTGLGEIYQYVLYPAEGYEDKISPMQLRTLQDWVVRRQLAGVKGVIEVNSSGGFLKEYEIAVNPEKLKAHHISITDLYDAVANNNANTGGAYIEKKHYVYFIRGEGLLHNMEEIKKIPLKYNEGLPLLIGDIAEVRLGYAPRYGAVTMNAKGEVVAGQVMMLKGENSAEVTRRVKEKLEQIKLSLPEGVELEPYLDRTKLVNRTIGTVKKNLLEGGLIVIFVLVLLLGNLRAGLIVASVIPLSMLFAIGMMRLFGVSANLMSLGAIDFGLVVDGAVIIVEATVHYIQTQFKQKLNQSEMDEAVFIASSKIRKSAAFGVVIILIVYLPILFLSGIEGKMFKPMAQTVSFALLGALILSLTYVPMVSAMFLSKQPSQQVNISDRLVALFYALYKPLLGFALRFKWLVLTITILVFVFTGVSFLKMGGEFIPTLEEGDFALHQILPPGSSIAQSVEVSAKLQEILTTKFPEVEKVVTKIGTAEIPTDIMPMEAGDIYVSLKPREEWTSGTTREELFEKMEAEMNKYPGIIYEFTQPIQMRFNELMTGVRQDIALKIYGDNMGILQNKAMEAKDQIAGISGVGDIQVEVVSGLTQATVRYDRQKLAKYGLSVATLNRLVSASFAGEKAGVIYEGESQFDLVIRLAPSFRDDPSRLNQLYIPTTAGVQIPLSEVASIQQEEGPVQVSRDNGQRRIVIGINARNRDVQSLVDAIRTQLTQNLDLPDGYYITYGGQFENLQKANARLAVAVPAALALILLLLYFTFGAVKQAVLVFTAIPLAAIGGVWALQIRGMPFSISAGVGFIALFGVAVLNGIVLISYFNQLKEEGLQDIQERIIQGTKVRFRPVMMTAAVASLGFLPMAISHSAGAEVQRPLATVVIGGLITATLLTLVVLPLLYYYSEKIFRPRLGALGTTLFAPIGVAFFCTVGRPVGAQTAISLEKAMEMGLNNSAAIAKNRLKIREGQKMVETAGMKPFSQLYFTTEEMGRITAEGIYSLGINQSFYLPAVKKRQQEYLEKEVAVTNQELQWVERQTRHEIAVAYWWAVYAGRQMSLYDELQKQADDFKELARIRLQAGESGKLPFLAAQVKSEVILSERQSAQDFQERTLSSLRSWVSADTINSSASRVILPADSAIFISGPLLLALEQHPAAMFQRAKVEAAKANIATFQSIMLPQIQTGLQLQQVYGDFPKAGILAGLNFPLFARQYKNRIATASLAMEVETKELDRIRQIYNRAVSDWQNRWKLLQNQHLTLREKLIPMAQEQMNVAEIAFQSGQETYVVLQLAMDQLMDFKKQSLQLEIQLKMLEIEALYGDWGIVLKP